MAKLILECQDGEGNRVFFATSDKEGKELTASYTALRKWLGENGFTQVKVRTGRGFKPKAKFDGEHCPKCGEKVWDNRSKKADGTYNAKAPDFACSNKDKCDWRGWPDSYEIVPKAA